MVYHVIGTMSGSSMDGLDIAYCILEEIGGKWSYQIPHATCVAFDTEWKEKLTRLTTMPAKELLLAHTAFGHWMGQALVEFMNVHQLHHKIHLIASHGHTVFHEPAQGMTFQLGDGAAVAAQTSLPVVSDLRNLDIALGGQGAPIVPIGEKLLWPSYSSFLNLGGISNITLQSEGKHIAFDVCAANRMLNALAQIAGQDFDINGDMARQGQVLTPLLDRLNTLDYYQRSYPKSLANEFGTEVVFPMVQQAEGSINDKLRTYTEHIAGQVAQACAPFSLPHTKMLITGGGALNTFLVERISSHLSEQGIQIEVPDITLVQYKEALVMALIGALRWREESNVMKHVTGASRDSVGGALWMGQE
jgi:anhydro-N-acetylmuramic acid kinase